MHPRANHSDFVRVLLAALLSPAVAIAQYGQPPPGGGGFGGDKTETPEGPAEQAPEEEEAQLELTPPYWPGEEEAEVKFFDLHGYFRFRGLLIHNPTLGALEDSENRIVTDGRPNFFPSAPLSERPGSGLTCADRAAGGADVDCPANTLAGGNMRFRLEPTINVNEEVRIKSQIDIFDNLVLGSTPDGFYFGKEGPDGLTPLVAFSGGQAPPESGFNTARSAVRVKRVWGEVRTPLGELRFGRMPSHWGLGILANNGDCLDCDHGDSADRLLFATKFAEHLAVLGHDWASTGPTTETAHIAGRERSDGQPIDLDQLDDVGQFFLVVGRIDEPPQLKDKLARGEAVLNYGSYFVWRRQAYDWAYEVPELGNPPNSAQFIRRGAWAVIPDGWVRLSLKNLEVEAEGVYVHGQIDDVTELGGPPDTGFDVRQWGFAQRTTYKAFRDTLQAGLEVGAASGDEAEMRNLNSRSGGLNTQPACIGELCPKGAAKITAFRFDPDYIVDMVLFRQILGGVTNAFYFKSFIQYDPIDAITLKLALMPAWALEPIATPGNESWYGIEMDTGIFYQNLDHGFHAGLQWGVFFSAGAFNSFRGSLEEWDAGIAQAMRGSLAITF